MVHRAAKATTASLCLNGACSLPSVLLPFATRMLATPLHLPQPGVVLACLGARAEAHAPAEGAGGARPFPPGWTPCGRLRLQQRASGKGCGVDPAEMVSANRQFGWALWCHSTLARTLIALLPCRSSCGQVCTCPFLGAAHPLRSCSHWPGASCQPLTGAWVCCMGWTLCSSAESERATTAVSPWRTVWWYASRRLE